MPPFCLPAQTEAKIKRPQPELHPASPPDKQISELLFASFKTMSV